MGKVKVIEIPNVAHGGEAVADMNLIRACKYSFGNGMGTGKNDIIGSEVEAFDRSGEKGKEVAVVLLNIGELLQKRSVNLVLGEGAVLHYLGVLKEGIDRSVYDFCERFENFLSACKTNEPIMY